MKKWIKENWQIILIILLVLLLFYKPLFSNQPLGLDGIGHLSKVSYLQQFPFANWDMSWYSGTLFLKMYSPLFYYVVSLFQNIFFASNLFCFLSLLFIVLGIYFVVEYLTKDKRISLISSIGFLTVLSISYYWIATANFPYFTALWTIPFSLYFLERSIREKSNKYFIFYSIIFFIAIITHIVVGFLIGIFMIIRFLFEGFNFKNIKKMFFYGVVPVLISAFWFIPFLFFSNSSMQYRGYVPGILSVFGFGNCCWGLKAGGIGILLFLFLLIIFISFFKKDKIQKDAKYCLTILGVLGFLLFGGLLKYYPFGVDPVRFILPFSIILAVSFGLLIKQKKFLKNRLFMIIIICLLFLGLVWNLSIINQNFEKFSYYGEGSRYLIIKEVIDDERFPLKNEFINYRFGTSRYVFGETINYFMPYVQHNFGYQDTGMLNLDSHNNLLSVVWNSNDLNQSIYYLDWFGIKYFEGTSEDSLEKFENDTRFKLVGNFFPTGYYFKLYEYLDAKPIISLVDYLEGNKTGTVKEFSFERQSPDKIIINYIEVDNNDVVLFKEFYHKNWKAKSLSSGEKLDVKEVGPGFMAVYPEDNSIGVIFYYKKNFIEYFSIFLSFLGIIFLFGLKKNFFKKCLN